MSNAPCPVAASIMSARSSIRCNFAAHAPYSEFLIHVQSRRLFRIDYRVASADADARKQLVYSNYQLQRTASSLSVSDIASVTGLPVISLDTLTLRVGRRKERSVNEPRAPVTCQSIVLDGARTRAFYRRRSTRYLRFVHVRKPRLVFGCVIERAEHRSMDAE